MSGSEAGGPSRRLTSLAALLLVFLGLLCPPAWAAAAEDAQAAANKQFVQALMLVRKAEVSFDPKDEAALLREAERLIDEIVQRWPESAIAVQIVTNQYIGDFDVYEFRQKVRSLVCNEALSTACFLYRIEEMLPPLDDPITTPRWDWLSLAVAHHLKGSQDHARELIQPFVAAARRGGVQGDAGDLFVSRALALMGQTDLALQITRGIPDCSTRLYNLTDIAEVLSWRGAKEQAAQLAEEAKGYAAAHKCTWELGLVVQALLQTGREAEARTLFLNTVEQQFSRFQANRSKTQCCPAELAVAAAQVGDPNLALNILRTVQDESPWTIPAVLGRLARRGETQLTGAFLEQVQDVDLRAEILGQFVSAAIGRGDPAAAQENLRALVELSEQPSGRRPTVLAQRAVAERQSFEDERWRTSFQAALNAAEKSSAFVRRDIGAPLLAALIEIETGNPLLD
ncbi:hypothetical protein [Arenibaculum pallidiluteum]|uniref:hypothetical protein n=1 Tax=Arenibaculum pallidiluteum TaxID=2812559 RepID=UPI001F2881D1|nr:hypothetical protein [Arenibaculum pallidiluteum]